MPIARGRGISHVFDTALTGSDFDGFVWGSTDISPANWGDVGGHQWGQQLALDCVLGVFKYPGNSYANNQQIFYNGLTNSELTNSTYYYIIILDADNFQISDTPSGSPVVTDTFDNLLFLQ